MPGDPYKYFRIEGRELLEVLSRGFLELEKGLLSKESVGRLLRAAHTLKGASRVVKQLEITDLAHAIEDLLAPHREGQGPFVLQRVQELLRLADAIAVKLSSLAPPATAPAPASSPPVVEERFQTVRVETAEVDRLLTVAMQASVQLGAVRLELQPLEQAKAVSRDLVERMADRRGGHGEAALGKLRPAAEGLYAALDRHQRSFSAALDQTEREVAQVRDMANALRLLPASALFPPLERAMRDAAQSLQRRVEFQAGGGENRLDANVLAAIHDVLLHLVRNAVAHGIESEGERIAAGKPPEGRVEIRVERMGHRISFICRDDGRGIDVEAIRHAAARRKLRPPGELAGMGPEQIVQLMLKGGVSTTAAPTEISGRGIGLDVVRETLARLQGEVVVRTVPGHGTTFELRVPFSLSSIPALLAEASGVTCGFPMDAVKAAVRIAPGEIARSAQGASILFEGAAIPFLPLAAALDRPVRGRTDLNWSSIIVHAAARTVAVGVDRMFGTTSILLKPIPPWVSAHPVVAGASLDASGDPLLVLDPAALAACAGDAWRHREAELPTRPPVLVVDDSLTTRMLEQSILESAGYEVDLAVSGEEALRKARERRYGMMIVDVEMPGMDGFELIARTRSDPVLRDIPALLVTSRNSLEDRRRGEEVGARAYIVKSDFDQKHLMDIIRALIG